MPVVVGAGHPAPLVRVYIEDADTNQNWVPDAIEYVDGARTSGAGALTLLAVPLQDYFKFSNLD